MDRNDANLGYDMWFDDFQHGYGRCKTMRCGEFAPPLLKGAGAAYGHDVGEPNTCSDGDKVSTNFKNFNRDLNFQPIKAHLLCVSQVKKWVTFTVVTKISDSDICTLTFVF